MDPKYMPDFRLAIDHFLIHTGGRAVIEEVEKKLSLDAKYVQPSKETLYRFGNTCCAAVFYVLTNVEARVRAAAAFQDHLDDCEYTGVISLSVCGSYTSTMLPLLSMSALHSIVRHMIVQWSDLDGHTCCHT